MTKFWYVGIVGLANLSALTVVTVVRLLLFLQSTPDISEASSHRSFWKKIVVHILVSLSVISELPMYIGFLTTGDYVAGFYGLHKLQSALLFMAFSIIIRDWSKVLYDMKDYGQMPFLLSRVSLVVINVSYLFVSIFSCIYLWVAPNIDDYLESPMYIVLVFAQIVVELVLVGMMLHAGLQLATRIKRVVGQHRSTDVGGGLEDTLMSDDKMDSGSQRGSFIEYKVDDPVQSQLTQSDHPLLAERVRSTSRQTSATEASITFKKALTRLNIVMFIQFLCIAIQALLLLLNYSLGYVTNDNTVGPYMFYWTFSVWLPMWGMVVSLLFLMRSSIKPREKGMQDSQFMSQPSSYSRRRSDFDMNVSVTINDEYVPPGAQAPIVAASSSGWRDTADFEEPRKEIRPVATKAMSIQSPDALLNLHLDAQCSDCSLSVHVDASRVNDSQTDDRNDDRRANYSDFSMRTRISASQASDIEESVRSASRSSVNSALWTAAGGATTPKEVVPDSNLWER